MDYAEHERTYQGFIKFTKLCLLSCATILVALALFAFGGAWGTFLGTLSVIGVFVALVVGLLTSGEGVMPAVVVFLFSGLFLLFATL